MPQVILVPQVSSPAHHSEMLPGGCRELCLQHAGEPMAGNQVSRYWSSRSGLCPSAPCPTASIPNYTQRVSWKVENGARVVWALPTDRELC